MANLFWKTAKGTKALLDRPFKTEEEFERTVFETSELLKDITRLKRQVRGGNKTGVPDIIGVDNDGAVCIIELKNCEVDASIIPQVLNYAIWAETNPDSIKALWLESDNKPDEVQISWDALQVRILVIAPTILRSTLAATNKITYPVDLLEVKRWVEGKDEFLLVNKLEPDMLNQKRPRSVSGQRIYDAAFYKTERDSKTVDHFMSYVHAVEKLAIAQGWQLETKYNRWYCGFKVGFFNAFGIGWWSMRRFGFFVKLSRSEAYRLKPRPRSYDSNWKQAYYEILPGETKVEEMLSVLDAAYHKLAGSSEE